MQKNNKGPLSNINVVEFTHWLAGPVCGTILSDFGANVIKVEPLTGEQVRETGKKGQTNLYEVYNHGKKGISLNLKSDEGKKIARKMLERADVVIENFRPGVMEKLGLGYEDVMSFNPRIVYCSISAFGNTPAYKNRPGMDPIIQGMGAVMSMTAADENSPPLLPGISIADNSTAFMAFGSIASALYERERSGEGQLIKLNLIDMMVLNLTTRYGQYLASGENPKPMGNQHSQVVPYQAFPTKDGWMMAGAQSDQAWEFFCKAIHREDLFYNENYQTNALRVQHRDTLSAILNDVFRQKESAEWCEIFEEKNILHGPIWGIHELINSDLIQDHNIIQEVEHTKFGKMPLIRTPIEFSRTKTNVQFAANLIGEHTEEILKELGYSDEMVEGLLTSNVVGTVTTVK